MSPVDPTTGSPGQPTVDDSPRPYPVFLHLHGARCLVVGAGPIAARKARGLLDSGAHVTVVAPRIGSEVRGLKAFCTPESGATQLGTLDIEVRPYTSPEAATYRIVVSASGDADVDARVTADALSGGALVNRADSTTSADSRHDRTPGTITLPAIHRSGPVTVTVSTDGASPALARWLRDRTAAAAFGPDVAVLAELVDDARRHLLAAGRATESIDWPAVFDHVAPMVADGHVAEARAVLAGLTEPEDGATPRFPRNGK